MSVIVKHPNTKDIILLTKGADSQILSVLHKRYKGKYITRYRYNLKHRIKIQTKYNLKHRIKIQTK